MADVRHFDNGFIAISQPGIIRFQCSLVCRSKLCFQGRLHDKVHNFANSKLQMAAILKIVFSYISTIYCLTDAKFRTKKCNYTQIQITRPQYSSSRHLNRDNKTANINVKKTVVYLQLITAK